MYRPSNLYQVYQPYKYLLVHYKEELKIIQQLTLQVGCLVSAIVNKEDKS